MQQHLQGVPTKRRESLNIGHSHRTTHLVWWRDVMWRFYENLLAPLNRPFGSRTKSFGRAGEITLWRCSLISRRIQSANTNNCLRSRNDVSFPRGTRYATFWARENLTGKLDDRCTIHCVCAYVSKMRIQRCQVCVRKNTWSNGVCVIPVIPE